jgi:TonB family protein
MEDNNNIKKYSAADIEKYWKGQLSRSEMNALEKAALDDPFLADALEGYQHASSAAGDIVLLNQKLDERLKSSAKLVPMGNRRLPWLRVAAALVIIAGLGVLVSEFLLNNKEKTVAIQTEQADKSKMTEENNAANQKQESLADTTIITPSFAITTPGNKDYKRDSAKSLSGAASARQITHSDTAAANNVAVITSPAQIESKAPAAVTFSVKEKAEVKGDVTVQLKSKVASADEENDQLLEKTQQKKQVSLQKTKNAQDDFNPKLNNSFTGRVVDAQRNAVPFANVTNTRDQVGTYTDISGKFNLVSVDSVLDVQIKSLGYETRNYRLVSEKKDTNLVMQEDLIARSSILNTNNRRVVSNRAREENRVLEEPEPVVGWNNYDTYVANNFNIPDDIRSRNTGGEVELSFQVDKRGQPTDIKITRTSQCQECDQEAIRLLKEGPKWKRKGKKSKTSVVIAVNR